MHTIQIPDPIWEAFGASPNEMRAALMAEAIRRAGANQNGDGDGQLSLDPEPAQRPRVGTLFTAGRHSWCPSDGTEINPNDRAVMMDHHDPATGRTRSAAFCLPCAESRGWVRP